VGSRERKRSERRKRKRRAVERQASAAKPAAPTVDGGGNSGPAAAERPPSRSELKDQAAREALQPLSEGERPLVVTIGAVISGLIALSVIGAYLAGAEVDGERPAVAQVLAPTILMGVMAYGMWRARYWAVLGFGVVLVFLIIGSALGLVQAANGLQVLGRSVILIGAGTLFFFMIKAMARIQMPERPGAR
jgi:hypothetical protein